MDSKERLNQESRKAGTDREDSDKNIMATDLVMAIKKHLSQAQALITASQTSVEHLRDLLQPPVL